MSVTQINRPASKCVTTTASQHSLTNVTGLQKVGSREEGMARQWMATGYGTPAALSQIIGLEQRIAELAPDSWSPVFRDGPLEMNHATGGPTEYAQYVGPKDRNSYALRTGPAVASPAPATVIHSGKRATVRPYEVPRDWVGPQDLMRRCYAAARLTLTGKSWTPEHLQECASVVMLSVLEAHPLKSGYVAPEPCQMIRLVREAGHWRRTQERDRLRDSTDAANTATLAGQAQPAPQSDETIGSPMAAAKRAIDALQNLGLDRRVWPLAYTAARVIDGCDGAQIAAELSMSPTAYRQAVSRARKYVPSASTHDYVQHLDAIAADCEAFPMDPRAVPENMGSEPDWPARSASKYKDAPIDVKRSAQVKRDGRRNYPKPDWTVGLHANTARRLATAATMKRTRAAARTADETATLRMAHGLPATVR